jgi:DNA polymerase elongation subunit (family B)
MLSNMASEAASEAAKSTAKSVATSVAAKSVLAPEEQLFSFKLLVFNPYDAECNKPTEDDDYDEKKPLKVFLVQMFGINEQGETACIFVEGYTPFFYVKVGDNWDESMRVCFIANISRALGENFDECIIASSLMKRKQLYGFDGGKEHTFILIQFKNEGAMKKAEKLWYNIQLKTPTTEYKKTLKPEGYMFEGYSTLLYETQVPPLLRLFHIQEISPSGWIALPESKVTQHELKTTSCTYEYTIKFNHIISQPKKETRVPYKICSFDIEASSSHGDFPLAEKDYKKLAMNIVDLCSPEGPYYNEYDISDGSISDLIKAIILTAFGFPEGEPIDYVDIVYPQTPVTVAMVDALFTKWIAICPAKYKGERAIDTNKLFEADSESDSATDSEADAEGDTEDAPGAGREEGLKEEGLSLEDERPGFNWRKYKNKIKPYKKKGNITDLLAESEETRDTKIVEITRTLSDIFPPLQGDTVTFIGSTFLRYGENKPYLNHCIALGTCDDVENAEIVRCTTEKELLLQWTKIIQKEDPDIIIGYNIFGFDYQFMFSRARELCCERNFLRLSRNKKDICLNRSWKNGKVSFGLEETTINIASGQHDLKYVKMTGRLQIDLYNYLRRDYQLAQYKLDYVSGYFIGDGVKKIEHIAGNTKIYSKNLTGLENKSFISFEEEAHSIDAYKNGQKFEVYDVDIKTCSFMIKGLENPNLQTKKVRWGLAKDDLTPQDIFRMTNEGPAERAIVAKYCIQDCNLVHHLMRKIDVITGYVEMANLCSVPLDFLVLRGQGIKLTSYIAKKCREKNTLLPMLDKGDIDEGYEGATVLEPKCNLYLDEPIACLDYSSLYPSAMMSENISHDSKVYTREYDLNGRLLKEIGIKNGQGVFIYDHLPGYEYVDIQYDTYKWQRKGGNAKARMEKVKVGYKICRFAQFPEEKGRAIMPSILEELLAARKATRKLAEKETDDFMKNVLDKRQLSIKVTANSMYGQTGAKTSTFYEKDCAASTTAIGRKLLTYGKRVIEEAYKNQVLPTKNHGLVRTNAEYVYGDTDSVFFKFNLTEPTTGEKILGEKALEITIELAKQAGQLASKFLKKPHDLEYEKTFMPFCLLSKKRYVGMMYEDDHLSCKRKSMGIVLKRRDNAPIVKDVYGGVIDILMKDKKIETAIKFLKECMQNIVEGKYEMDKLVITKSLKSSYKKPQQIAHKVLADRMGKRDAGNKPGNGDRIPYIYIENPDRKALQGARIETPAYIIAHNLKINYAFYITNQMMKPLQQVFALVLEQMKDFQRRKGFTSLRIWKKELETLRKKYPDPQKYKVKEEALRNKEVKVLLFDEYIRKTNNANKGAREITDFYNA